MSQIFISYRRADSQANTDRIYERLVKTFGKKAVFKDVDDIPAGADFPKHLEDILKDSEVVLLVIGHTWATVSDSSGTPRLYDPSDFVRIEAQTALNSTTIKLIPVLVNNAVMPSQTQLPEALHPLLRLNASSVRNDPDFDTDIERLIRNLKRLGIQEQKRSPVLLSLLLLILISGILVGGFLINSILDANTGNTLATQQTSFSDSSTTVEASDNTTLEDYECGGLAPRLAVGMSGYVTYDLGLFIRHIASSEGNVLAPLNFNQSFEVVDGPQCSENTTWWKVELDTGASGWIVEGFTYYLLAPDSIDDAELPNTYETDCPNALATRLEIGDIARLTESGIFFFRSETNLEQLQPLPANTLVYILGGPVCQGESNNILRWYVRVLEGDYARLEGWVSEGDTVSRVLIPLAE